MSSSDSSDDENFELLREAADKQFINDSMYKNLDKTPQEKDEIKSNKPSLRSIKDESEQFKFLDVTPGFQQHVAKQLSNILEKKLNKSLGTQEIKERKQKARRKKAGIKLFSESTVCSKLENDDIPKQKTIRKYKAHKNEHLQDIDFKQIAVNPQDIFSQKDIKHWAARRRSKVFEYKKLNNGKLEYIEPKFV